MPWRNNLAKKRRRHKDLDDIISWASGLRAAHSKINDWDKRKTSNLDGVDLRDSEMKEVPCGCYSLVVISRGPNTWHNSIPRITEQGRTITRTDSMQGQFHLCYRKSCWTQTVIVWPCPANKSETTITSGGQKRNQSNQSQSGRPWEDYFDRQTTSRAETRIIHISSLRSSKSLWWRRCLLPSGPFMAMTSEPIGATTYQDTVEYCIHKYYTP